MTKTLEIIFQPYSAPLEVTTAIFATHGPDLGKELEAIDTRTGGLVKRAGDAADFKGKAKQVIELLAPAKLEAKRLLVIGAGKLADQTGRSWIELGGFSLGQITARKTARASIIVDVSGGPVKADEIAASLAMGALLRHYSFSKYLTKKPTDDGKDKDKDGTTDSNGTASPAKDGIETLVIHCADPDKARAAFEPKRALANGICLARDLVNEPANILGPVEFAERVKALESVGVEVEILEEEQLRELGMNTLLAVSVGSIRPARVAVMQWNGAKTKRAKPLAFVGKGVTFDTGGISIKPAAGMEDMKGDMGGAACVVGLMHALAERKAPVNAVGLIGIVENMPSGSATRPGDIVTSMSGQTVEILNTDAEGRLVLADVLWYTQERFKPRFVINLATLTGAIMIALGKEFAGMFANDDKLAEQLSDAAKVTGEKVWRMPLDKAFHKMIDSKNADVKNLGGRWGGSCTAAAFLERFIKKDMPWVHLDIAGTAMDAPRNDISTTWASGWGVQLLDRLVHDNYEKADK